MAPSNDEPSVCYLTTIGRNSGGAHTIEIWFTAVGRTAYLISGGGARSDWVKNLLRRPSANVRLGDRSTPVVARLPLAPSPERDRAVRRLHDKYGAQVSGSVDQWLESAYIVALDGDAEAAWLRTVERRDPRDA